MAILSTNFQDLRELFVYELRDLYHAEQQLVDALPKMAEAAHSDSLKTAFKTHLEQTKGHVTRLENVFTLFNEAPEAHTCKAMKGLIAEGSEFISAGGDLTVRDAGLISAAQRVEHYEIAGYGALRSLAQRLGQKEAAHLLQQTLDEEGATDKLLTSIADGWINQGATKPENLAQRGPTQPAQGKEPRREKLIEKSPFGNV